MISQQIRGLLRQVFVGAVVASCAVSSGMSLGFSGVANGLQEGKDQLTEGQYSWFTSISSIATPFGCLLAGPMLDALGRKPTLLALNAPFLAGWVLLATAPAAHANQGALAQLYIGRLLTGFSTGMAAVPATVYLGEMAQPNLRGMFITWTSLAISIGILVVYVLGSELRDSWRVVAAICAALPAAAALLQLALVPESPAWLVQRGRPADAERSLRPLRGVQAAQPLPPAAQRELDELVRRAQASAPSSRGEGAGAGEGQRRSCGEVVAAAARLVARPEAWKPLLIMNGFFLFMQITGIYVVVQYAVDIVEEAGVKIDSYLATVLLGAIQVLGGFACSFALRVCGRRPMSVISGAGQTVAMVALGLYLQLGPVDGMSWLPLVAMLLFVVSGAIGFHTLPWAMLGEVFPARVRGVCAGLTTCLAYLYNFAMLKVYPSLRDAFKDASDSGSSEGLFYFFGAMSALGVVFVLLFLPETHGRSIQEIEDMFAGRAAAEAPAGEKAQPAVASAPAGDIDAPLKS